MIRKIVLISIALAFTTIGCAHSPSTEAKNESAKTVWQFRYQYVRLEPQDICSKEPAEPNDHPVTLSADDLRMALASLKFFSPHADRPVAVFSREELDTLVPPMVKAFRQAHPDEDVTLAIEGTHPGGIGYRIGMTTARLFYRNGKLNLIIGCLHAAVNDYDSPLHVENTDRRLKPFPEAYRCHASALKVSWAPSTPGLRLHDQDGGPRNDWLVLSLGQKPAATPAQETPAAVPNQKAPPMNKLDDRNIVHRLQILKQLRDQDLITDQEFKAKKQQILQGL
jgi:hypothetical protein